MATEFKIKVRSPFGTSIRLFSKGYAEEFHKTVKLGIKKGLTVIAQSARDNHRFKNDTENLQNRSILEDTSLIDKLIGKVAIDDVQAPYGVRIHQGFASWDPDPFIFEAGKREERKVIDNIFNAIKRI